MYKTKAGEKREQSTPMHWDEKEGCVVGGDELMMPGYSVEEQWTLEKAYNYFVQCLRDLLTKWALGSRNQEAGKGADELVMKACQRGFLVSVLFC
uniref:Uncharacterized protein n=1 Tax=Romanomermis culicivorax TaxID=13658 RepID=A0A915IYQ4_ROMCU